MKVFLVSLLAGVLFCQPTLGIEGCLRYTDSTQNACSECDLLNLYYLTGSLCTKSSDANCDRINTNGKCAFCVDGHFLSLEGTCLQVNSVQNCAGYNNNGSQSWCSECKGGHLLVEGACITPVPSCTHYDFFGA